MEGLAREVWEETEITEFQVDGLLTIAEGFYPKQNGGLSHTIHIIYKCSLSSKPTVLISPNLIPPTVPNVPVSYKILNP